MTIPPSKKCLDAVHILFPPSDWDEALRVLVATCGYNLPLLDRNLSEIERVRLAVLKLSSGSITDLLAAIDVACADWRDILIAAFPAVGDSDSWQPTYTPPPLVIRQPGGAGVAHLQQITTHSPSWSHPRAEIYLEIHELRLFGCPALRGRYFSGRHLLSPCGSYLALEEYDADGTPESLDRVDVRLIVVRPAQLLEAIASSQAHGSIIPRQMTPDLIAYDRFSLDQAGVARHFEREVSTLTWSELRFNESRKL